MSRLSAIACLGLGIVWGGPAAIAQKLTVDGINKAEFAAKSKDGTGATLAKAQILLDRARFSPGVIDGRNGDNVKKAIAAFQRANELKDSGQLDAETWKKLSATSSDPVLKEYKITDEDVKGPFVEKIPEFEKQAELKRLGYTSAREKLAEAFHMDEEFLRRLNAGKSFDRAGETIVVADVSTEASKNSQGNKNGKDKVVKIEVDKPRGALRALDKDGKLVAFYPATIGSDERPAPSGTLEVRTVATNPTYTYNPEYKFKGVKSDKPFQIAPGPNNPVGTVWIDLTKEGYGIHGTPDPDNVSKNASHGCVRLTNWDAEELARMVSKGTSVVFIE
jgi:lipoprotein-anchoring transpeptidase ErfK/SrfK